MSMTHGSVAAALRAAPESTETTLASEQRGRIAAAIRARLETFEHLVEMLRIGAGCPDPEECLSTVDALRRRAAELARELRRASPGS